MSLDNNITSVVSDALLESNSDTSSETGTFFDSATASDTDISIESKVFSDSDALSDIHTSSSFNTSTSSDTLVDSDILYESDLPVCGYRSNDKGACLLPLDTDFLENKSNIRYEKPPWCARCLELHAQRRKDFLVELFIKKSREHCLETKFVRKWKERFIGENSDARIPPEGDTLSLGVPGGQTSQCNIMEEHLDLKGTFRDPSSYYE